MNERKSLTREQEELLLQVSDAFRTEFKPFSDPARHWAQVSFSDGERDQLCLVVLDLQSRRHPLKVYPLAPSGQELFGYDQKASCSQCAFFGLVNDPAQEGEVMITTARMKKIFKAYAKHHRLTAPQVHKLVQEVAKWVDNTARLRKDAKRAPAPRQESVGCKQVIFSQRAYTALIAEAASRDPDETVGILMGQYDKDGTWYVVETTDPGLETLHSYCHSQMDSRYGNHILAVQSRLYRKNLILLGLWHRHPGSLDEFSREDKKTNAKFAASIGNGALSMLLNIDPVPRLTCYYLSKEGQYSKVPVQIGDQYFENRKDYLELCSAEQLWQDRSRLHSDLLAYANGG